MKTNNIMIVGVGGQGSLLASKLIGNVAQQNGLEVKVSEVHGMSPVSYTHLDVYKRQVHGCHRATRT